MNKRNMKYNDEIPQLLMFQDNQHSVIRKFMLTGHYTDIEQKIKSRYDSSFRWGHIPLNYQKQDMIQAYFSILKDGTLVFDGADNNFYLDCDRFSEF